jgi:hypothetical protein
MDSAKRDYHGPIHVALYSLTLLIGCIFLLLFISGIGLDIPHSFSIGGIPIRITHPQVMSRGALVLSILFIIAVYGHYFFFRNNSYWRIRKALLEGKFLFSLSNEEIRDLLSAERMEVHTSSSAADEAANVSVLDFVRQFFPSIRYSNLEINREPYRPGGKEFTWRVRVELLQHGWRWAWINRWSTSVILAFPILLNLFGLILLLSQSAANVNLTPKSPAYFANNPDVLWEEAIKMDPCLHVTGVPIVGTDRKVSMRAAALSTIAGYYDAKFPVLGPPTPHKVQHLAEEAIRSTQNPEATGRFSNLLSSLILQLQDKAYSEFLQYAEGRPYEADGLIRAYAIDENYLGEAGEALQMLATPKYQVVRVRNRPPTMAAFAHLGRSGLVGILSLDEGAVYPVIGQLHDGEIATIIDPGEATYIVRAAADIFLTPQDRQSNGEFARHARTVLKDKTVRLDINVSCIGPRPSGVRFINVEKLPSSAELSVIEEWKLDIPRLLDRSERLS